MQSQYKSVIKFVQQYTNLYAKFDAYLHRNEGLIKIPFFLNHNLRTYSSSYITMVNCNLHCIYTPKPWQQAGYIGGVYSGYMQDYRIVRLYPVACDNRSHIPRPLQVEAPSNRGSNAERHLACENKAYQAKLVASETSEQQKARLIGMP